jgi:plastocyanin
MLAGMLWVGVNGAAAAGTQRVEMRDDCDPKTFNQAIGPGACVGNGDTTFNDFIARLTKDHTVGAWRNNPDKVGVPRGTSLSVHNEGGETHSFTCVTRFGGGVVDLLNQLSGNTTPAVPCDPNQDPRFVPAGGTVEVPLSSTPGTYQFQCLIHPWMRTVVTVKDS